MSSALSYYSFTQVGNESPISVSNKIGITKEDKISFSLESSLFSMIKLLIEYRNQINLINSVLSINAYDLDLVQKLNYCMDFLTHIPFSYRHNNIQTKILLEIFHFEEEEDLITNVEL